MKLIDYDALFREYFEKWYDKNKNKYEKPEEIEQVIPELYQEWMKTACKPLLEMDSSELVSLIDEYNKAGSIIPDIVCEAIVRRASETENALFNVYKNNMFGVDVNVLIINMLSEMDSELPIKSFVDVLVNAIEDDEITNACAEALYNTQHDFSQYGINSYRKCKSVSSKELLLNALINKNKTPELTDFVIELYYESDNKAFVAAMMGELGDEKCLPILIKAAHDKTINYLDYTEICNSIEMLGGEITKEREFEGDVYYEMMKKGDIS